MTQRHAPADEMDGMRSTEQSLAMVLGIGALVLGAIGLLRGFGWIEIGTAAEAPVSENFASGLMWMLPALAAAILAVAMARSDHHHEMQEDRPGQILHMLAYAVALGTLAVGVLALLTGFNWIGMDTTAADGFLWGTASVLYGLIAWGFHAAVPATITHEDYLVALVESRVGSRTAPMNTPRTIPETERRS